LLNNSVEIRFM